MYINVGKYRKNSKDLVVERGEGKSEIVIDQIHEMQKIISLSHDPLTVIITNNLEPVYGVVFSLILFKESELMSNGFYFGASVLLIAVFTYPLFKRKFNNTL